MIQELIDKLVGTNDSVAEGLEKLGLDPLDFDPLAIEAKLLTLGYERDESFRLLACPAAPTSHLRGDGYTPPQSPP